MPFTSLREKHPEIQRVERRIEELMGTANNRSLPLQERHRAARGIQYAKLYRNLLWEKGLR